MIWLGLAFCICLVLDMMDQSAAPRSSIWWLQRLMTMACLIGSSCCHTCSPGMYQSKPSQLWWHLCDTLAWLSGHCQKACAWDWSMCGFRTWANCFWLSWKLFATVTGHQSALVQHHPHQHVEFSFFSWVVPQLHHLCDIWVFLWDPP